MSSPVFPYHEVTRFTTKSWRQSCDPVTKLSKVGGRNHPSARFRAKGSCPLSFDHPFRERRRAPSRRGHPRRRDRAQRHRGARSHPGSRVALQPGRRGCYHVVQRPHSFEHPHDRGSGGPAAGGTTEPGCPGHGRRRAGLPSSLDGQPDLSPERGLRQRHAPRAPCAHGLPHARPAGAARAGARPEGGRPRRARTGGLGSGTRRPRRVGVGSHRRLRVRWQLGGQHRQRLLGWAAVQPLHVARLRRDGLHAPSAWQASREQQIAVATNIYNAQHSYRAWPVCGRRGVAARPVRRQAPLRALRHSGVIGPGASAGGRCLPDQLRSGTPDPFGVSLL